jgi:hypothetical protein
MLKLLKNILIILLPVIVMLTVYLIYDPFEVVYPSKVHSVDPRINCNWDYNETETLIRNYDERHYDSFIFGSSRSNAFHVRDWQQYIGSTRTLHYSAAAETLYGIYMKLKFMDVNKMPIRNCLMMVDTSLLPMTRNSSGMLFIKHPILTGESLVDFHLTFIRAFMDPSFFLGYLSYKLTGTVPKVFSSKFVDDQRTDPVTCDKGRGDREKELAENSERYYERMKGIFYQRDETKKNFSPPVLKKEQLQYLNDIRKIFAKHGTNYQIVINPNYDQKYLDRGDLARLQEIFGADNVHDYSGINDITRDFHNYYETSHFRPHVAQRIMAEIYAGSAR